MLATLAASFMILSGYFYYNYEQQPLEDTPAALNFLDQLPYSFLYFCSYIRRQRVWRGGVQGWDITFANFERGKPAESKAQIAHFKSTWEQEKVLCDYINSSDKCTRNT